MGSRFSFLYQDTHFFGANSKVEAAFPNMFIAVVTNQVVIVICRDSASLQIDNLLECGIGTG